MCTGFISKNICEHYKIALDNLFHHSVVNYFIPDTSLDKTLQWVVDPDLLPEPDHIFKNVTEIYPTFFGQNMIVNGMQWHLKTLISKGRAIFKTNFFWFWKLIYCAVCNFKFGDGMTNKCEMLPVVDKFFHDPVLIAYTVAEQFAEQL